MSEVVFGYFYDIGGREIYEDRVDARVVDTAAGRLIVGVVADGVGGANQGERAAQLAKDTVISAMGARRAADVPALLTTAVQDANRAVYSEFAHTKGASTTLTVAAIDEKKRLFVANVGDSRVYLCRNGKLTQLTCDHTFANVMPWQGKMSPELARENPRADVLMLALGPKEQTPVDVGFYVGTTDYTTAAERGRSGLPLKEGDSILVCSDGLVKDSSQTGEPFTTPEEIVRVLTTQEGEKAARSLVSFAMGRNPEDNISTAVLQMPDPERRRRARRPMMYAGIAIVALALSLVLALFGINRTQAGAHATQTAVANAQATAQFSVNQTAAAQEQAIGLLAGQGTSTAQAAEATAAFVAAIPPTNTATPQPTATPLPTPIPGQVGIFFNGSESWPFTLDDPLPAATGLMELQVDSSGGQVPSSSIYAGGNSRLEFAAVDASGRRVSIRLLPGSDIFVETGGYVNEVFTLGAFQASIQSDPGACLSLTYPAEGEGTVVTFSCHKGVCFYRLGAEERVQIEAGQQVVFDLGTDSRTVVEIPRDRQVAYRKLISQRPDGLRDADVCGLVSESTPTPTLTPSLVPTQSRATEAPSNDDNAPARPRPPTDTPNPPVPTRILPTVTPPPGPTATPPVLPTSPPTSIPPTATSPAPTATVIRPTATLPPPPTSTPPRPTRPAPTPASTTIATIFPSASPTP